MTDWQTLGFFFYRLVGFFTLLLWTTGKQMMSFKILHAYIRTILQTTPPPTHTLTFEGMSKKTNHNKTKNRELQNLTRPNISTFNQLSVVVDRRRKIQRTKRSTDCHSLSPVMSSYSMAHLNIFYVCMWCFCSKTSFVCMWATAGKHFTLCAAALS